MLSFVAQNERENIKKRQAEGIAAAKARGEKFGRNRIILPDSFDYAKEMFLRGELNLNKASDLCGMRRSTFYKHAKLSE